MHFGLNCDQMEPPHGEQHGQYPVERNPNAYSRSMRDYRNPPWMNTPSYMVPPTNSPYGNTYNLSWGNHPNSSWEPRPPQYAPPASPYYASTPQPPQPPQLTSSVEQEILNLSKLVDTFIEEQRAMNIQASQKIDTVENNMDKRIDGLQSEIDQKFDNLHKSISRLANQEHVYPKEEYLIDITVEKHCKQKLQEELIETGAECFEGLSEFSNICTDFCPSLLTEESSGKEEEPQKPNLKPLPTKMDLSATAQATKSPLPTAPSPDQVYILPIPAAQSTPKTPTAKAKASPSLLVQNLKKLVASNQTFATTSQTLAVAHTA